jgi:hypothetical protein
MSPRSPPPPTSQQRSITRMPSRMPSYQGIYLWFFSIYL